MRRSLASVKGKTPCWPGAEITHPLTQKTPQPEPPPSCWWASRAARVSQSRAHLSRGPLESSRALIWCRKTKKNPKTEQSLFCFFSLCRLPPEVLLESLPWSFVSTCSESPHRSERPGATVPPPPLVNINIYKENQPHYVEQIGFWNICFLLVMVVLLCSLPPWNSVRSLPRIQSQSLNRFMEYYAVCSACKKKSPLYEISH